MSFVATNISVFLSKRQILHDLAFHAEPGQVTAIVGPNGSGKSTLLKALTGEVRYSGEVTLNGRPIQSFQAWELAIRRAVLAQSTSVAFPFTVREIVQLGQTAGLDAKDANLPDRLLEQVDLSGFADRYYHELSGGEQQRVQLARALAQISQQNPLNEPRWLILDEPVSSLDIGHQYLIIDLMRDFANGGGGVIAVMHDLNLTAMCADQIVLMQSGRVLAAGTARHILTGDLMTKAYECHVLVDTPAPAGIPYILPQARS